MNLVDKPGCKIHIVQFPFPLFSKLQIWDDLIVPFGQGVRKRLSPSPPFSFPTSPRNSFRESRRFLGIIRVIISLGSPSFLPPKEEPIYIVQKSYVPKKLFYFLIFFSRSANELLTPSHQSSPPPPLPPFPLLIAESKAGKT